MDRIGFILEKIIYCVHKFILKKKCFISFLSPWIHLFFFKQKRSEMENMHITPMKILIKLNSFFLFYTGKLNAIVILFNVWTYEVCFIKKIERNLTSLFNTDFEQVPFTYFMLETRNQYLPRYTGCFQTICNACIFWPNIILPLTSANNTRHYWTRMHSDAHINI